MTQRMGMRIPFEVLEDLSQVERESLTTLLTFAEADYSNRDWILTGSDEFMVSFTNRIIRDYFPTLDPGWGDFSDDD